MARSSLLKVEGINVAYGKGQVLFNVSVRVDEGEPVSYTHLTLPTIYSV